MAHDDFTDSRSRDQYPVDDDQDGRFENIDSDDTAIDADRITEFSDIPPTGMPDDYDTYGQEAPGDRATVVEGTARSALSGAENDFDRAHADIGREELRSAAVDFFSQLDPGEFQASVEKNVNSAPDAQVTDGARAILQALEKAGIPVNRVTEEADLSSHRPGEMDKSDLSSLVAYAQQASPDALADALADNPRLGQILGAPILKGILARVSG
ncbi:MAG TPA: hypothetical protein VFJ58_08705 [Armatimonadota bacterium]|nr:hypothetical protein [Armatimonadota bacterium]